MSTPTFPSLLRRSAIATYDPLITRIYTSPTSSVRRGDWGLKSSLPTPREGRSRSKYIRVQALDDPSGIGCDWSSGESEARFMERWADGRYGWQGVRGIEEIGGSSSPAEQTIERGGLTNYGSDQRNIRKSALVQPKKRDSIKTSWMPDIEGMSESQFEDYLEDVRSRRTELRDKVISENVAGAQDEAMQDALERARRQFKGLAHHYVHRANKAEATEFIADTTTKTLESPTSTTIHPIPHPRGGIAYSTPPESSIDHNPLLFVPGLGLNPISDAQRTENQAAAVMNARRPYASMKGQSSVVGVGGLTGQAVGSPMFSTQHVYRPPVEVECIQPGNPAVGTANFRVAKAALKALPRVVASSPTSIRREINPESETRLDALRDRVRKISPLESAAFDMKYTPEDKRRDSRVYPGSKDWISPALTGQSASDLLFEQSTQQTRQKPRQQTAKTVGAPDVRNQLKELLARMQAKPDQAASTSTSTRTYMTSARVLGDKKPTADIPVGKEAGAGISGPGIGDHSGEAEAPDDNVTEEDGVATGNWRELEDDVAGEARYGKGEQGSKRE